MLINKTDPTVNDALRQIAEKKPYITELAFEFKSITDLLPYLHYFQKLPRLRKLSLHGNRIKQLPTDLSVFQNLQQLDITNNLLDENVEMTIISLKTIPKLRSLQYHVKKEKEVRIGQELKQLQYLNNTRIIREKVKKQFEFKNTNAKTLSDFEALMMENYRTLMLFEKKYLGEINDDDDEQRFKSQLQAVSKQCLQKLYVDRIRATESVQNLMLYKTKFQMYELLKIRGLNLCMDIYSDLGKFIKNLLDEEDKLFKMSAALTLARAELFQIEKEDEERYNNQFQSQHSIVNKNAIMQKELKRMRKQKDQLIGQLTQLQNNNKKLAQTIMKLSHGESIKQLSIMQTFQTNRSEQNRPKEFHQSNKQIDKSKIMEKSIRPMPVERAQRMPKDNLSGQYNSGKGLTLKQLKDTIQEIYDSKVKFDEKNFQGRLGRQTMNQYLFTYLNQKYGLKSLTIEAASNIVNGIQDYSSRDNDVAVFGKILRNEVDEEFRFVQTELKATINDLLKMHVKAKMPYKSTGEINDALQKKVNGYLSYEECEDLVKYLYNKEDAAIIMISLQPLFVEKKIEQPSRRRGPTHTESSSRSRIEYGIFLQQVLNFQLKNHEKLLRPLVNSFKLKDKDADGIVDEQQFIGIIELLCEDAVELIPSLLQTVDPYETKKITFTQMVRLVANYPEQNPILNRYAMQNQRDHLADFT